MGAALSQTSFNTTIAAVSTATFILGAALSYIFNSNKDGISHRLTTSAQLHGINIKTTSADYMPSIVLCLIAICFTGGIGYVMVNKINGKDSKEAKDGIRIAIGLAWALFIIAVILIPASLSSAKISADSKYYLMAALFTFYFSTIVAIIIFFNKLYNLPTSVDQIDFAPVRNAQMGLLIGTVAYGITSVTYM